MKNLFCNKTTGADFLRYRISAGIFLVFTLSLGCGLEFARAQTVIGGSSPEASAMLDIQSTSKGVLFPRMTTAERTAITNPATGLMVFNSETKCLEINLGTPATPSWQNIKCLPPGTVGAITNCSSPTLAGDHLMPTILVTEASGNTITIDYSDGSGLPFPGETVGSTGVTGLTARLEPGTFASGSGNVTYIIEGTANVSGVATFDLEVGGQTCSVKVPVGCGAYMAAGQWKVFSCFNLGAANTSGPPFDLSWEVIGDYWQWGDKLPAPGGGPISATDGNEAASATSWPTAPGTADYNNKWLDASKTIDDPCPTGFRVPTKDQWENVDNETLNPQSNVGTWTANPGPMNPLNFSAGKKFGPGLLLPAAGVRFTDGAMYQRGSFGAYWTSTDYGPDPTTYTANNFQFGEFTANTNRNRRDFGYSIRCIEQDLIP